MTIHVAQGRWVQPWAVRRVDGAGEGGRGRKPVRKKQESWSEGAQRNERAAGWREERAAD